MRLSLDSTPEIVFAIKNWEFQLITPGMTIALPTRIWDETLVRQFEAHKIYVEHVNLRRFNSAKVFRLEDFKDHG